VDCVLVLLSNYYTQVLLFIGGKDRTLEYTNDGAYLNIKFQLTNCLYILPICICILYIRIHSIVSTMVFARGRLCVVTFCQFSDDFM
jgi:hypothetical protein